VFAPYTSIKTNLLFFTKGEPTKEVWYYEHPYPEGYKSYSKTKPMRIEEFEPEKAWWTDREESERAWRVSVDDIAASGYNLDIKNPNTVDEGPRGPRRSARPLRRGSRAGRAAQEALKASLAESLGNA
jgi:type I restriction enzyme M protein